MYKWYLAWRYLHTKLIALFGVASVTLCVMMVLVVMSVMGGFLEMIRSRSKGLMSEIILDGRTMQGFPMYGEFGEHLKETMPDLVVTTTPTVMSYGIFRIPSLAYTKPTQIVGIKLDEYVEINAFKKGLHYESFYPGTTSLGPQEMPVAGLAASGKAMLPSPFREAHEKWMASATPEEIEEYEASPFAIAEYPRVLAFPSDRVFAGDLGSPRYEGPEYPGAIVGADLLFTRRDDGGFGRDFARGAYVTLTVLPLTPAGNARGEPPVSIAARYADDSRTGVFEIDKMSCYIDFDVLQKTLAMDPQPTIEGGMTRPRASQLLIDIVDDADVNAARDVIREEWARFLEVRAGELSDIDRRGVYNAEVFTWEDMQRDFINAVEKERVLVTLLFGLISMVAIMLIGLMFYMIVEKKIRDIGILKALGASGRGVAGLFIVYGLAVGVVGSILGITFGTLFVININDIQELLAAIHPGLRVWSPAIYSFDRIPEEVDALNAAVIGLVAIFSSVVGSLIPAGIAGRVWPVKALRHV